MLFLQTDKKLFMFYSSYFLKVTTKPFSFHDSSKMALFAKISRISVLRFAPGQKNFSVAIFFQWLKSSVSHKIGLFSNFVQILEKIFDFLTWFCFPFTTASLVTPLPEPGPNADPAQIWEYFLDQLRVKKFTGCPEAEGVSNANFEAYQASAEQFKKFRDLKVWQTYTKDISVLSPCDVSVDSSGFPKVIYDEKTGCLGYETNLVRKQNDVFDFRTRLMDNFRSQLSIIPNFLKEGGFPRHLVASIQVVGGFLRKNLRKFSHFSDFVGRSFWRKNWV